MALHETLSEEVFRRSVKKYFIDRLYTTDGVYVDFDTMYKIPKDNLGNELTEWIVFHFDGLKYHGNLAIGRVAAYMFSRKDNEGVILATLRDKLMEHVIDLNMPDGLARVPLYDVAWTSVGGMIITTGDESRQEIAKEDTKYKFLNLYFKYGAK